MVNGLRLATMEASDMLDVIHYFFEEDYRYSTYEESAFKDQFRTNIYKELYQAEYRYSSSEIKENYKDFDAQALDKPIEPVEVIEPFNPRARAKEVKPYVEPTDLSVDSDKPFGSILDQPLG